MTMLTDGMENVLIDHIFRGITFTPPANWYVALYTAAPTDSTSGTEVSGGAYARVAKAVGTTEWANTQNSGTGASSGTSGTTQNINAITFPTPSASWGTIVGVGLVDASTGGNLRFYGAISPSKTVNNGDPAPYFPAGSLTLQIDN